MKAPSASSKRIRIVAGLITDLKGRILLVRKKNTSHFMQPGGKAERDEDPEETLRREILEELGCSVRRGTVRFRGRFVADAANEPDHQVDAEVFELEIDGEPMAKAEIVELSWLHPNDRQTLNLAPLTRDYVLALV